MVVIYYYIGVFHVQYTYRMGHYKFTRINVAALINWNTVLYSINSCAALEGTVNLINDSL